MVFLRLLPLTVCRRAAQALVSRMRDQQHFSIAAELGRRAAASTVAARYSSGCHKTCMYCAPKTNECSHLMQKAPFRGQCDIEQTLTIPVTMYKDTKKNVFLPKESKFTVMDVRIARSFVFRFLITATAAKEESCWKCDRGSWSFH